MYSCAIDALQGIGGRLVTFAPGVCGEPFAGAIRRIATPNIAIYIGMRPVSSPLEICAMRFRLLILDLMIALRGGPVYYRAISVLSLMVDSKRTAPQNVKIARKPPIAPWRVSPSVGPANVSH